jgi:hypothetical protein
MTLSQRLAEAVRAGFAGLWIASQEPDDAVVEIARTCREQGWTLATWDLERSLAITGQPPGAAALPPASDPLAAIRALPALATPDGAALLLLRNLHRFTHSIEVVQALDAAIAAGKSARTFVVALCPVVQIPVELERQFLVLEHALPDRDQLAAIAGSLATEPGELPEGTALEGVLDAAAGLTRLEAEGAFAVAGPPRPAGAGTALGAQGPDAEGRRPAHAPAARRLVRRAGRAACPEGLLHSRPAARPAPRRTAAGRAAAGAARLGQVGLRAGAGGGDRPAHADP